MSRQTLIEKVAGKRYRIGWDESARHEPGGKTHFEKRDMYQLIPCQYGDIYKHAAGALAWYCVGQRIYARVKREAPEWLHLHVDCDGEGIFTFPAGKFPEVVKWAHPRRRRVISEKERQRLLDMGKATHFTGAGSSTATPDAHIDATPGLTPLPR